MCTRWAERVAALLASKSVAMSERMARGRGFAKARNEGTLFMTGGRDGNIACAIPSWGCHVSVRPIARQYQLQGKASIVHMRRGL